MDWLLAEQEQFSSAATLRFVDLDGLPQDKTKGFLNKRSLTDVHRRARELIPRLRKGNFTTENKPNKKHHKMYWQFFKPPGRLLGEYSRENPRATSVEGDDRRYKGLKKPMSDSLFAAYDPLDIMNAKYLIVASSDYLYMPRSLFWPDVIFLTAPKLEWGQAVGMKISVRRIVSMDPQVMTLAGSNDHQQSQGLLTRLTDRSVPSIEVMGEAIMTLLSAVTEVETLVRQRFTKNAVKIVFILSPGYAALPKPLQLWLVMLTAIADGRFNVINPAPNRSLDHNNYDPLGSELPAVWADFLNVIQGFMAQLKWCWMKSWGWSCPTPQVVKTETRMDDDHVLVQQVATDLWFRQMDYVENAQERIATRNLTSSEEDLMALALRKKPHTSSRLYLSPRACTLGEDAFKHAPAVIKEIHVYLKNLLNEMELAECMMIQLMLDVNAMSLDKFETDSLATKAQYERLDAILGGMRVGWTPFFLSTCFPRASWNLIASFVKDIRKLSIGLVLAMYLIFGHENFVKEYANLSTQALADLRLDGILSLITMTYGQLGDLLCSCAILSNYEGRAESLTRSW